MWSLSERGHLCIHIKWTELLQKPVQQSRVWVSGITAAFTLGFFCIIKVAHFLLGCIPIRVCSMGNSALTYAQKQFMSNSTSVLLEKSTATCRRSRRPQHGAWRVSGSLGFWDFLNPLALRGRYRFSAEITLLLASFFSPAASKEFNLLSLLLVTHLLVVYKICQFNTASVASKRVISLVIKVIIAIIAHGWAREC